MQPFLKARLQKKDIVQDKQRSFARVSLGMGRRGCRTRELLGQDSRRTMEIGGVLRLRLESATVKKHLNLLKVQ